MSTELENPQAFPVPSWRHMLPGAPLDDPGPEILPAQAGMTLRDWFAGKVMEYYLGHCPTIEQAARCAYEYADTMLTERTKKP